MLLGHGKRLYRLELRQPARQIAAHDVGVGLIVAPFTVNDNQVTQAVTLRLANEGKQLLAALLHGLTQ